MVRLEPESDLVGRKQSFVQTLAEAFGQFDSLLVAQQAHDVPQAVVHSLAVITGLKVLLDTKPEARGEIALQVIRQLPADQIAIDFYNSRFARHQYHRSMGCRDAQKVTLAIIFARHLSFETFVTLLNPTAT
jgi:hypothetical protein